MEVLFTEALYVQAPEPCGPAHEYVAIWTSISHGDLHTDILEIIDENGPCEYGSIASTVDESQPFSLRWDFKDCDIQLRELICEDLGYEDGNPDYWNLWHGITYSDSQAIA